MVSGHRNQSAHRLVQQKHKAGANATNAAQSHTHTQIHIKNTKDTNTLDVQRSRQKGICFPSASPPPSLSPSLADPVPGPRHVWGRGQEGLGRPPSALLPAPWGPDGKLGLQPEPRLPPRLPSPPRLPAEAGEGSPRAEVMAVFPKQELHTSLCPARDRSAGKIFKGQVSQTA